MKTALVWIYGLNCRPAPNLQQSISQYSLLRLPSSKIASRLRRHPFWRSSRYKCLRRLLKSHVVRLRWVLIFNIDPTRRRVRRKTRICFCRINSSSAILSSTIWIIWCGLSARKRAYPTRHRRKKGFVVCWIAISRSTPPCNSASRRINSPPPR